MDRRIPECSSEKQQKSWSDYVKLSKYFSPTLKRCQSMPCLSSAKKTESSLLPSPLASPTPTGMERSPPYLSLSWQLACSPVDPTHRQDDSAQRQRATDLLHRRNCRQVDLKARPKPKKKARKHRVSLQMPVETPKIVVVNATTMRAYRNQRIADSRLEDRMRERSQPVDDSELEKPPEPPKKTVPKIKNLFAVPLCQRPTTILGSQLAVQQNQQQQQQPEEYYQTVFQRHRLDPFQHVARLARGQYVDSPKYAVPLESVYNQFKKGSRFCGNFYYR